jgi:hypothetical protein
VSTVPHPLLHSIHQHQQQIAEQFQQLYQQALEHQVPEYYINQLKDHQQTQAPFFTLAIIGAPQSGKTTLLQALIQNQTLINSIKNLSTSNFFLFPQNQAPLHSPYLTPFPNHEISLAHLHAIEITIQPDAPLLSLPTLESADVILAVFSADDPWKMEVWDCLAKLPFYQIKKTLLILQKTELRTSEELPLILEHFQHLSRQKLTRDLPSFHISALKAQQAFESSYNRENLYIESAIAPLQNHIEKLLLQKKKWFETFHHYFQPSLQLLKELQQFYHQHIQEAQHQHQILNDTERECLMHIERIRQKFLPIHDSLDHDYHQATQNLIQYADSLFSWLIPIKKPQLTEPSNLVDDNSLSSTETLNSNNLSLDYRFFKELCAICNKHWDTMSLIVVEEIAQYKKFLNHPQHQTIYNQEQIQLPDITQSEYQKMLLSKVSSICRRYTMSLGIDDIIVPKIQKAKKLERWTPLILIPIFACSLLAYQMINVYLACGLIVLGMTALSIMGYLILGLYSQIKIDIANRLIEKSQEYRELFIEYLAIHIFEGFQAYRDAISPSLNDCNLQMTQLKTGLELINQMDSRIHDEIQNLEKIYQVYYKN